MRTSIPVLPGKYAVKISRHILTSRHSDVPARGMPQPGWNWLSADFYSDLYDFLFELNPDWSRFYAPGPEIEAYIKRTAEKYDLYKNIQFNSKLTEATWDESSGKWRFRIEQNGVIKEDEAHIFINAGGILK